MILYGLYRIGTFITMALPLKAAYGIACVIADLYYYISRRDRVCVINNLRVIMGESAGEGDLKKSAKEVFRNFAKYLVDFFRFEKVDGAYMKKFVKVEGRENVDAVLAKGKGGIMLSAHIGNWELGAGAVSLLGYDISTVVLTHQNRRINDFFRRQRVSAKVSPIEIGAALRSCYTVLRTNKLLGLLGDRDFTKNGLPIDFFGNRTLIPKGPAVFSCKLGCAIIPTFMIREPDDTFKLIFDKPMFPNSGAKEDDVIALAEKYSSVIELYVRKYPTQWYVFKDMWNDHEESLRPDTII